MSRQEQWYVAAYGTDVSRELFPPEGVRRVDPVLAHRGR
jgi:hypothetical protein